MCWGTTGRACFVGVFVDVNTLELELLLRRAMFAVCMRGSVALLGWTWRGIWAGGYANASVIAFESVGRVAVWSHGQHGFQLMKENVDEKRVCGYRGVDVSRIVVLVDIALPRAA